MKTEILILFLISVIFQACDFVEEEPKDFLSPANFYQSEADATAAVNAVYNHLADGGYYGSSIWNIGDVTTELVEPGESAGQGRIALQTYTFDPATGVFAGLWNQLYRSINRANTVIDRVPMIDMNVETRARLVAEAKFLRALNYFDLVKVYGDIPLLVTETTTLEKLNVSRTAAATVYDQIVADLEDAVLVLPESYGNSETGRATSGAARALLAKVYLFMQEFDLAAQNAEAVINMNYSLVPDYADLWRVENENGPEHIFSVQYRTGIRGSGFMEVFAVRGGSAPITGFSGVIVEEDFLGSFDPADIRRDVSIRSSYTFPDGSTEDFEPHVWKFFDPNASDPSDTDVNWPVLRFADVLLIYAEALNEVNNGPTQEAYNAINQVRSRAGVPDLPDGLDQGAFRDAVLQERAWELCFEGHRWFDLKRSGKLIEVITAYGQPIQDKHLLFPIPLREMDTNPELEQNPGY